MQPLLTPEQLAARLSLHPETVRRLTREKKIPALLAGGVYRYDWHEVRAALETSSSELVAMGLIELIGRAASGNLCAFWAKVSDRLDALSEHAAGAELELLSSLAGKADALQAAHPCTDEEWQRDYVGAEQ